MELMDGRNNKVICTNISSHNKNIWQHGNPLNDKLPLLLFQLSSILMASLLINMFLKPLGQTSLISQIFGGMILGPSLIGRNKELQKILLSAESMVVINIFAAFGIMFFMFTTTVKLNASLILRPGRKAAIIGSSALIVTLVFSIILVEVLKMRLTMSTKLHNSLVLVAIQQSLTGFPVIATLLIEFKLINTDVGRLALTSALFCELFGILLVAILLSMAGNKSGNFLGSLIPILSVAGFVALNFIIVRPTLKKIFHNKFEPKFVGENRIVTIFILVILSAILSEIIGQHYIFGPLVLGFFVPAGPRLGAAISSRLDALAMGFFYPVYCAISGLQIDVFTISLQAFCVVGTIVVFAFIFKLIAVMLPALCLKVPLKEAFVLGLILNTRGIVQLTVLNIWKGDKLINDEEFSLLMISVIVVTAITNPIIKMLYDPSKQQVSVRRSTIYHSKNNLELRFLVCIHNPQNLQTIMNVLEVSYASEKSHVAVTAMVLVELVGSSTPELVASLCRRIVRASSSTTDQVSNALFHFKNHNKGCSSIQLYTSISHFQTMHDDICRIALDTQANIVIMPFHKEWVVDGEVDSKCRPIQNLNMNILEKAPCSVGILVDKGNSHGFVPVQSFPTKFCVAVLFIGGPDDKESLAYGSRMVNNQRVNLTVIRFLLLGNENSKETKKDSSVINEYRRANVENERFMYVEEVLRDAVELSKYITEKLYDYQLILVGRCHRDSPLLEGLEFWSEYPELGVIGDMLASADTKARAIVLVIQQHTSWMDVVES